MDYKLKCKIQNYTLKGNIWENVDDLENGNDFSDTTVKLQPMKEIITKLNFIKVKNFSSAKDNARRMRRQASDCGKIFVKTHKCNPKQRTLNIQP